MHTEAFFSRFFAAMDAAVAPLLAGRGWFLRTGAAAVALCLLVHTPHYSFYFGRAKHWESAVYQHQAEHPLTPFDVRKFHPQTRPADEGIILHLDKCPSRLTVPMLGRIFGTGMLSWLIFDIVAGLAFFPLLAFGAERWLGDRRSAAYVTLAFAGTWMGAQFFNDNAYGDGVAWVLLLVSVSSAAPGVIFLAVLGAGFTDERALIASAGTVLYWAWDSRWLRPVEASGAAASRWHGARQWGAVVAAWVSYCGLRIYLARAFGLVPGRGDMLQPIYLFYHLTKTLPYGGLMIFKGLWLWLLLGAVALGTGRRRLAAGAYAGLFCVLSGIALAAVFDIERTLGYLVILFPLAWRAGALLPENTLFVSRLVLLFNVVLISPWDTPLHFASYFLHKH